MHKILDLRNEALEENRKKQRPESDIDAIVLHQMANFRNSKPRKFLKTTTHFIVLQDGTIAQLHNYTDYIHASNNFNSRSVAIEFEGNLPDDKGNWWHDKKRPERKQEQHLTYQQVSAGRYLMEKLMKDLDIGYVLAHRQAYRGKRTDGRYKKAKANCPGPHIWFNIAEKAIAKGLSDGGPGYKVRTGKPIPDSWRDEKFKISQNT